MNLEEAQKYATMAVSAISSLCDKIEVVGSIRRKRPQPRDIDIVVIPDYSDYRVADPFHNTTSVMRLKPDETWTKNIPKVLKEQLKLKWIKGGPELLTMAFPDFLQVDIYRATTETWGVLTLIRTGSKEHNICLCARAKRMDLMLSAKHGILQDAKVIASRTEEEIFKALQMDFIPPELRI